MGRQVAAPQVRLEVPPWLAVVSTADPQPVQTTLEDGSTELVWALDMEAAIDTPTNQHTIYDEQVMSVGVRLLDCAASRLRGSEPSTSWTDLEGVARAAFGHELIVECD